MLKQFPFEIQNFVFYFISRYGKLQENLVIDYFNSFIYLIWKHYI